MDKLFYKTDYFHSTLTTEDILSEEELNKRILLEEFQKRDDEELDRHIDWLIEEIRGK